MHRIRGLAPILSLLAFVMLIAAGTGTRLGLWDFRFGFQLLRWSAYFGIAGAGLGLVALLWRPAGSSLLRRSWRSSSARPPPRCPGGGRSRRSGCRRSMMSRPTPSTRRSS
jgi:hypothetical protein